MRGAVRGAVPSLQIPKRVFLGEWDCASVMHLVENKWLHSPARFRSFFWSVSRSQRSVWWCLPKLWFRCVKAACIPGIHPFLCCVIPITSVVISASYSIWRSTICKLVQHQQRINKVPYHGTNLHRVALAGAALSFLPWWVCLFFLTYYLNCVMHWNMNVTSVVMCKLCFFISSLLIMITDLDVWDPRLRSIYITHS